MGYFPYLGLNYLAGHLSGGSFSGSRLILPQKGLRATWVSGATHLGVAGVALERGTGTCSSSSAPATALAL